MYLSFINCNHNFILNAVFLNYPKRHDLSSKFSNTGIIYSFSKSRIMVYLSNSNQFWPLKVELQTRYRNQNSFVFSKQSYKCKALFWITCLYDCPFGSSSIQILLFFSVYNVICEHNETVPSCLSRAICVRYSYFLVHYVS